MGAFQRTRFNTATGSRVDATSPETTMANLKDANLSSIAWAIEDDWSEQGKGVNYAAQPYLSAMQDLDSIEDNYGLDDGKGIVAYFLANASTYRGETARAIKAELKRRLK